MALPLIVGVSGASGAICGVRLLKALRDVPCSIRTASDIAYGTTDGPMSRAVGVILKERRRLVLVVCETPLHAGHLKSMRAATENGAIIMPPVPAFYHQSKTIDDIVNHTVGRCLDLFDIDSDLVKRWRADDGA